jgi:hypothetical protein
MLGWKDSNKKTIHNLREQGTGNREQKAEGKRQKAKVS